MNEAQKNAIREADNYLKAAGLPTYTDTVLSRKEAQNQLYDARDRFEKEKIRILTTSQPAAQAVPENTCAQCKKSYRKSEGSIGCQKCAPGIQVSEVEFRKPLTNN